MGKKSGGGCIHRDIDLCVTMHGWAKERTEPCSALMGVISQLSVTMFIKVELCCVVCAQEGIHNNPRGGGQCE